MVKRDAAPDRVLGMDRLIDRRDLLNGAAVSLAGALALGFGGPALAQTQTGGPTAPQDQAGYDPPALTGLRGSHPGSFEAAHALRDGADWPMASGAGEETYDLVVAGAGLSGLAAAYFYRQARPSARILILDNHDDFGGHAKRNEMRVGDRVLLMNGGSLEIDSPRPYSAVAAGLLRSLGVDPRAMEARSARPDVYQRLGLRSAVFFDAQTFGTDRLAVAGEGDAEASLLSLLAQSPLSPKAQADVLRVETDKTNPLPGLSVPEAMDLLSRISYRDYLSNLLRVDPSVLAYYQARTHGEFGLGADAVSALDCWGLDLPGFKGLALDRTNTGRMGNTPAGYASTGGSERFHFPDGNASIARLLVRALIPASIPGSTAEDVITAKTDYRRLDEAGAPVALRLGSLVVHARNLDGSEPGATVDYIRAGRRVRVRGAACVLAGYNMMIPYIAPDLPEPQKAALRQLVKVPLVYASVAIRTWRAFERLGVRRIHAPGGYFSSISLMRPQTFDGYATPTSPDEPMLLFLVRTPCRPGLATERDQHRAGRAELLETSFETFERNIRDQLGRALGAGGFDPAEDIAAITVNRWPHGYAYEYNPLYDPFDGPEDQRPHVVGRRRFGRIVIANSDAGAAAYADSAIDQAHRAIQELLALEATAPKGAAARA